MARSMNRRGSWVAVVLAGCAAACGGASLHTAPHSLTPKQIVKRSKPAIVRIVTQLAGEPAATGIGTGFVVTRDGHIATNLHVIRGSKSITVELLDGTKIPVHRVIAVDQRHDLAIIAVKVNHPLPTLTLGNSDHVSAGDRVIAIGNPLGFLDYTVSDGLISSVRPVNRGLTVLQISAPISQGSSGGPVFNDHGEVIGVASAIILEGENLNFAVPSNYLKPLMKQTGGESIAAFAHLYPRPDAVPADSATVKRKIPVHDLSILDGCPQQALVELVRSIDGAINVGAPLYNQGEREACYRVYEGTTLKLKDELSACPKVQAALEAGIARASHLRTYTQKAWALRDMFDGLVDVVLRKVKQEDAAKKAGAKPASAKPASAKKAGAKPAGAKKAGAKPAGSAKPGR